MKMFQLLVVVIMCVALSGCKSRPYQGTIVDKSYVPAHDYMGTELQYRYDWFNGEYRMMPVPVQKHADDAYSMTVQRMDGSTFTRSVYKSTYDKWNIDDAVELKNRKFIALKPEKEETYK